ncbi:MAG: L-2-hydroxyglutarate oxidase LhgO [Pseudohongiellaceae bacterium]
MERFDVCIVGAGVVGLAIAYQLSHSAEYAKRSILILDRLPSFGQSTSSRNSEVIHGGIYYPPGSLKAKLCLEGKPLLYRYLEQRSIPHRKIGKLIVAQANQVEALERILGNATNCGMQDLELLDQSQLQRQEPKVSACFALYSPSTGIIDSHAYMYSLLHDCQQQGVIFAANTCVENIQPLNSGFKLTTSIAGSKRTSLEHYEFTSATVINTAGLEAHLLARKIDGLDPKTIPNIYYCKGDYFSYAKPSPFSHLIYPVPEANTAGLGIHSTLDLSNQLKFGPDTEYIDSPQFAVGEQKHGKFVAAIRSYFPELSADALVPAYSGIRPKLSGPGETPADFMVQTQHCHGIQGLIQLFGIESPGLTASLALGKHIATLLETL